MAAQHMKDTAPELPYVPTVTNEYREALNRYKATVELFKTF